MLDKARDVALDVRVGILHGVANLGLRREMHESDHIEELCQELGVVEVAFDDEEVMLVEFDNAIFASF